MCAIKHLKNEFLFVYSENYFTIGQIFCVSFKYLYIKQNIKFSDKKKSKGYYDASRRFQIIVRLFVKKNLKP